MKRVEEMPLTGFNLKSKENREFPPVPWLRILLPNCGMAKWPKKEPTNQFLWPSKINWYPPKKMEWNE